MNDIIRMPPGRRARPADKKERAGEGGEGGGGEDTMTTAQHLRRTGTKHNEKDFI